jgi:hypothetical protein
MTSMRFTRRSPVGSLVYLMSAFGSHEKALSDPSPPRFDVGDDAYPADGSEMPSATCRIGQRHCAGDAEQVVGGEAHHPVDLLSAFHTLGHQAGDVNNDFLVVDRGNAGLAGIDYDPAWPFSETICAFLDRAKSGNSATVLSP